MKKNIKIIFVLFLLISCNSTLSQKEYKKNFTKINDEMNEQLKKLNQKASEKGVDQKALILKQYEIRATATKKIIDLKGPKDFRNEEKYDEILNDYLTLYQKYPEELIAVNEVGVTNTKFIALLKKVQKTFNEKLAIEEEIKAFK